MSKGWSTLRTYYIQHDWVGGVTNRRFNVKICSFLGWKLLMTPPPNVSGMLVNLLDPRTIGSFLSCSFIIY